MQRNGRGGRWKSEAKYIAIIANNCVTSMWVCYFCALKPSYKKGGNAEAFNMAWTLQLVTQMPSKWHHCIPNICCDRFEKLIQINIPVFCFGRRSVRYCVMSQLKPQHIHIYPLDVQGRSLFSVLLPFHPSLLCPPCVHLMRVSSISWYTQTLHRIRCVRLWMHFIVEI